MLYDMNVDAGPQGFMEAFLAGALNDLFDGEIDKLGIFPMQQSRSNPNFIRNLSYLCHRLHKALQDVSYKYMHPYKG